MAEELLEFTPFCGVHGSRDTARLIAAWGGHLEKLAEAVGSLGRRSLRRRGRSCR